MADSKKKRSGGGGGKGNATGGGGGGAKKTADGARFAADDARWGRGVKGEARGGKVRLDSRFADLFTNPDFAETFELDPLGRPVKAEESTAQRLRRVYELDPDVLDKANEAQQQQHQEEEEEAEVEVEAEAEADAEVVHDDDEEPKKLQPKKTKKAAAAKKAATQKKPTKTKAAAVEPEQAAAAEEEEEEGEETRRLAVCKCDWDKVRAVDILVLLQSFVPATGAILGVTVYPSRLGQQRLDEEAKHGPQSIFRQKGGGSNYNYNHHNNRRPRGNQSGDIDEEKLRQYELEKLDYYYAVVECDSVTTAGEIYRACDGLEFERSSNVLDLSFIPDDVTFDLPPRESAREIPSNYEAPTYYTSALQHSKVELTWDADDTHRRRVMTQKAKLSAEELKMSDFKAYLASDSDESDLDDDEGEGEPQFVFELETPASVEETAAAQKKKKSKKQSDEKIDPKRRDKYRALLGALDQDEEEQQDMEITFVPGLSEKVQSLLDAKDNPDALKRKRKREPAPKTLESDEDSDFFEGAGEFDGDRHSEDEEAERGKRGGNKKKARGGKKTEEERRQEAELSLLTLDEDIHRAAHKRTADDATGGKPKGRSARRAKAREEAKAAADLDLKDPRFRELVTSAEFAIDPTRIKKNSETVNKILVERSRVRAETAGGAHVSSQAKTAGGGGGGGNKGPFSDSSLSALVSSVKVKGLGPAKGRKGRAATTTTTVTTPAATAKRSK